MFARSRSKERGSTRKVTPPSPTYMSNEQFAAYLADLRNSRMNRPAGARPQPASGRDSAGPPASGRSSFGSPPLSETSSLHQRTQSDASKPPKFSSRPSLAGSVSSRYSTMTQGKDYYPDRAVRPLKPGEIVPSATYIERGQRWMEKEEAVALRVAMEDMDLKEQSQHKDGAEPEDEEDKRLYEAALDEAAELVWQHENPGKVPQPGAPYRYKPHLRKNSYAHARTASAGLYGSDVGPTGLARDPSCTRSVSGSSTDGDGPGSMRTRTSFASSRQASGVGEMARGRSSLERPREPLTESRSSKSYGTISSGPSAMQGGRRRSSLKRNISGEVEKPFSGEQIWEEPDGQSSGDSQDAATAVDAVQPLRIKPKNPLNRVQFAPAVPPVAGSPPQLPAKVVSKSEIHRNPPSQSRNPLYTTNTRSESPTERTPTVPRKHGMEIRSDDIRQATSMRLKDRSPKLPTPSAVSDNPGRPIVSFDRDWRPPEEATDNTSEESRSARISTRPTPLVPGRIPTQQQQHQHQHQHQQQAQNIPAIAVSDDFSTPTSAAPTASRRSQPVPPTIQVDGPPVPSISVTSDPSSAALPTIVLPDGPDDSSAGVPVIVTSDESTSSSKTTRPLPTPQPGGNRHLPARPRSHWSPAPRPVGSRATALCHDCGNFIEGRFVSLAGSSERFHPQCFSCYSCGTSLEALEISPEPDNHRAARLDRIARRAAGEILPEEPGETMAEDGDARLRFYCHLDWHELFAPRCKHCKTPIMGEHVVALGAHWHFGHFFCAECGDPFERGMTHIEKDGYAWCVSCQTKRTERRAPKCRKCRTAVIGQYIQALGGEWHDECFRCARCGGGFDDGQIFPMEGRGAPGETVVLCTGCMERELKA
ncbi:Paxillin [Diplogelasinospora grovesii]|uniref:Paxillin n=1 Tax=Diplogelasinospora grovesii TaxID=303347 RepID=A0AAN6S9R8_9PEZI|nr:Paxillin [Diplogelasinospora grovesii]